jgi:hypothetical protein
MNTGDNIARRYLNRKFDENDVHWRKTVKHEVDILKKCQHVSIHQVTHLRAFRLRPIANHFGAYCFKLNRQF